MPLIFSPYSFKMHEGVLLHFTSPCLFHPLSSTYLGQNCVGSRVFQTSFSQATLSTSSWGIPRRFQVWSLPTIPTITHSNAQQPSSSTFNDQCIYSHALKWNCRWKRGLGEGKAEGPLAKAHSSLISSQ